MPEKHDISSALKVTLLGSEWGTSAGGLSTLNRELAIHLSKVPKVKVSLLLPEGFCTGEEKKDALSHGVRVVDAEQRPGYDPLDCLSFPPETLDMDVVVGHGVKLGKHGQVIRSPHKRPNCKWIQMVHTAPEHLSKHKDYCEPTSKGQKKHQDEVALCKLADLVVPVGLRLKDAYSSYLRRCKKDQDIFAFIPGLFEREFGDLEQSLKENSNFKVLLCGRGDGEDFELKGYDIAAEAFTDPRLKGQPYEFELIFVGTTEGKMEEIKRKFITCGIAKGQLTIRTFTKSREEMKDLFCEVDLSIMPSRSEGFGLVSLEALSAGLPILVGCNSGFARALREFDLGRKCVVDSDEPENWAEAIEGVRDNYGEKLEEMKELRESYKKKYSWEKQCEALVQKMRSMVHGMDSIWFLHVSSLLLQIS